MVVRSFFAALVFTGLAGFGGPALAQSDAADQGASSLSLLRSLTPDPEGTRCVTRPVAIAEKVLEMHTQLMLTSLACAEEYGDPALHERYSAFTYTNVDVLLDAQGVMERQLGRGAEGATAFDVYRSELANQEARVLEQWGTPRYCAVRESRFGSLIDAAPENFEAYTYDLGLRVMARQVGC